MSTDLIDDVDADIDDLDLETFFGPDEPQDILDEQSATQAAIDEYQGPAGGIFDPTPVAATGGIGVDYRQEDQRLEFHVPPISDKMLDDADDAHELQLAERAVSDAACLIEECKAATKEAKQQYKAAVERLQELRQERQEQQNQELPKFQQSPQLTSSESIAKYEQLPEASPDARVNGEQTAATLYSDPAKRTTIEALGVTPALGEKLKQISGVRTIADLEARMRQDGQYWYRRDKSGVEGIGKGANVKVLAALEGWRKENPMPEPEPYATSEITNVSESRIVIDERLHEGEPEPPTATADTYSHVLGNPEILEKFNPDTIEELDCAKLAIDKARSFGRDARASELTGRGRPACPYQPGSMLAQEWFVGYSPRPETISDI